MTQDLAVMNMLQMRHVSGRLSYHRHAYLSDPVASRSCISGPSPNQDIELVSRIWGEGFNRDSLRAFHLPLAHFWVLLMDLRLPILLDFYGPRRVRLDLHSLTTDEVHW